MTAYWADYAWTGGDRAVPGVLVEVEGDRIARLSTPGRRPERAVPLPGLTLPGLVNAHSHAFHRALRGHVQAGEGTFWSWREIMYRVAGRLDPDNYRALATAVYAEMALAGVTAAGEFHYVHHQPGGRPYARPIAMAEALAEAASTAGIRLTLLDTCYLAGGFGADGHVPLDARQLRFGDADAAAWIERADLTRRLLTGPRLRVGAAVHSVRAVPADALGQVAGWARRHAAPLHAHVSEQPAENEDCCRVYGRSPVEQLAEHGALGEAFTAIHATHLAPDDIRLLADSGSAVCFCPTTERDLADGIGPAAELDRAGIPVNLGSDSHAIIDLLEEARGLELDERLRSGRRGAFGAAALIGAATTAGARALGWPEAGRLERGALADFVTLGLDGVRTAGWRPETLLETAVYAAGAADVRTVVVGGRPVVQEGRHLTVPDAAARLSESIAVVLEAGP